MPMLGLPAIAGIAVGSLLGGARSARGPMARVAPRRFRVSPDSRLEGRRPRTRARADGPGYDWTRGHAGECLRQYRARNRRRHRRGVVAELRVPADVSANRALWHLDRYRDAARRVAACRAGRGTPRAPNGGRRPVADDDAQRPGNGRAPGARRADRARDLRACRIYASGHRGHRCGSSVLCDRSRRLFRRSNRIAGVLRAGRKPLSRQSQYCHGRRQRRPERNTRAADRISGPGARDVNCRALQRHAADGAAPPRLGGLEGGRVARSFARIALASIVMAVAVAWCRRRSNIWLPGGSLFRQIVRLAASIRVALGVLAAAAHYLHIPEFREGAAKW